MPKHRQTPCPSSFGIKYPTYRNNAVKSPELWIRGKRVDDGAEGLWRIHNELYDLNNFMDKHPGGRDWIEYTKGTDITEAFEANHLTSTPEKMLANFHVRSARRPRNSPFTFETNGFYRTLKRNVRPLLKTLPKDELTKTKLFTDALMVFTVVSCVCTSRMDSYVFGIVAGIALSSFCNAAHNFCHKADNFRMHYLNISAMNTREFRIVHVLSHHLHTNTIQDLAISMYEPWFQYLSCEKTFFQRYSSWAVTPYVYFMYIFAQYYRRLYLIVVDSEGANKIYFADLMSVVIPIVMYTFSGSALLNVLFWWNYILAMAGFSYSFVFLNSNHHHPENFHDGDTPRPIGQRDWGIHQLDVIIDRKETKGLPFVNLLTFGDHALHHLFPSLDHGQLQYLYPVVRQTCKEFGIELRIKTQLEMITGNFNQLIKDKPNPHPPGYKKR